MERNETIHIISILATWFFMNNPGYLNETQSQNSLLTNFILYLPLLW